ncbi:MAG: PRC-barrel domain-containing protein [Pseudorhodobacter sp.]
MKMLLSTTAMVVALGFPNLMLAQTAPTGTNQSATGQQAEMTGFLSTRGQSDMFASKLMGNSVYARRTMGDTTGTTGQATGGQAATGQATTGQAVDGQGVAAHAAMNSDGSSNMHLMNRADLDQMENIGRVNDIVLSSDGQIRAIIIDVGGFLGMGGREVAITMDQVSFASDSGNRDEIYVMVNTDAAMLQDSPAYDRTAMTGGQTTDRTQGNVQQGGDRTAFTAPAMQRDGYNQVKVSETSSEMLVGKSVYGVNDDSVGTIDNLILDDKGAITNVIIDFGGFLGIGSSQVSLGFDELTILANDGFADVRVYIDATKEQVQAQPQYRASN